MKKIKELFMKGKKWYRKRKLLRLSRIDASFLCSSCFRILPPDFYILNDDETIAKEIERIRSELKETFCGYDK